MEKVYSYTSEKDLTTYLDADGFLIETIFSCYDQYVVKNEDILNLIEKIHLKKKKAYLRCDRILLENEIEELERIKELFTKADGIFFEDFSFVMIFEKIKNNCKLVYFPFEGIASIKEVIVLLESGIDLVILPHGKENLMKENNHYERIGISASYVDILFTSRRKLLSLKDINNSYIHEIKENTRDSKQNIVETSVGTIIFDKKIEIENIHPDCEMVIIDKIFIKD